MDETNSQTNGHSVSDSPLLLSLLRVSFARSSVSFLPSFARSFRPSVSDCPSERAGDGGTASGEAALSV